MSNETIGVTLNSTARPLVGCTHECLEVTVNDRIHFLHIIKRPEGNLYFLFDYYGWAVDNIGMVEIAKALKGY